MVVVAVVVVAVEAASPPVFSIRLKYDAIWNVQESGRVEWAREKVEWDTNYWALERGSVYRQVQTSSDLLLDLNPLTMR